MVTSSIMTSLKLYDIFHVALQSIRTFSVLVQYVYLFVVHYLSLVV